jgi:hypothetical protein
MLGQHQVGILEMRVVAARFSERRQANAALAVLQRELDPPDVAVAPLARSDLATSGDALLAGRFPDDQARAAVDLVEQAGGEIVADIDESWTGLNSASHSVPARAGSNDGTPATLSPFD